MRLVPGEAAKDLGRLLEGAQERPPHLVAITEACLTGDDIDGMTALFHQGTRGLHPEVFDGLGR